MSSCAKGGHTAASSTAVRISRQRVQGAKYRVQDTPLISKDTVTFVGAHVSVTVSDLSWADKWRHCL